MNRYLCAGKDPEWWTPESDAARLAMQLCGACFNCPDNDPEPAGVIRQGIPYADTGRVIPICATCGYPNVAYRGGELGLCGRCVVPSVDIPSARGDRTAQIRVMVAADKTDREIGATFGLAPESVRKLRQRHRILRRATPLPVPERVPA